MHLLYLYVYVYVAASLVIIIIINIISRFFYFIYVLYVPSYSFVRAVAMNSLAALQVLQYLKPRFLSIHAKKELMSQYFWEDNK